MEFDDTFEELEEGYSEGEEEQQPERLSLRTLSLWLVAGGLAMVFLTLVQISTGLRSAVAGVRGELEPLQATLTCVNTPEPRVLELQSTLAPLEASIRELDALKPTLAAGHVDWPAVMPAIAQYDPAQMTLSSLVLQGRQIVLTGRAAGEGVVTAYARSLESSGLYERVVLQSLKSIEAPFAQPTHTPIVTPSATPTPSATATPEPSPTVAATPTADQRDAYEPDAPEPRDIYLGQPQAHNFFPADDVDQVRFLAKAGRFYRVFTSDLAPGVDTYLTVRLGETVLTNDDAKAGALASEISLQVTAGQDVQAIVEIKNRGGFGPGMTYRVSVEEYIPTATPSPTSTPSPPAVATPSPEAVTATAVARLGAPRARGMAAPAAARHASAAGSVEFTIILVLKAASL